MTDKTTTTNTELLPCPMCSGEAHFGRTEYCETTVREQEWSQSVFHHVNCIKCGVSNRGIVGHNTREDAAAAWNKRAATATAPAVPAGWMPIETAPKDGTPVLIWGANLCVPGEMVVGIRSDEHDDLELWDIHDGKHGPYRLRGPSPTHWMPLPPAPSASPQPASTEALTETAKRIDQIMQSVCEWDDRTSPDYMPEALLITPEELTKLLRDFADDRAAARAASPAAESVETLVKALEQIASYTHENGTREMARTALRVRGEG